MWRYPETGWHPDGRLQREILNGIKIWDYLRWLICGEKPTRELRDFLNGLDNLHEYLKFSYPRLRQTKTTWIWGLNLTFSPSEGCVHHLTSWTQRRLRWGSSLSTSSWLTTSSTTTSWLTDCKRLSGSYVALPFKAARVHDLHSRPAEGGRANLLQDWDGDWGGFLYFVFCIFYQEGRITKNIIKQNVKMLRSYRMLKFWDHKEC